ncbi:MAG: menaquinone biosynthesis decarboxylase [Prevotellaceae bacterium]|jgi:4-hydroxy-3-polyprenylbenzoate decarboxylase|nr:menaquinone biosynthesis decarboxylase [Prevotellaceae bacterium]
MYKNLRQYVNFLEARGELLRVREFVDPQLEMAEVADRMSKQPDGGKALLFENTGTDFPVLMNMMGSDCRMSYALGVERLDDVAKKFDDFFAALTQPRQSLWEKLRLLPTLRQASRWFPRLVRASGERIVDLNPDLNQLPILKCWPHDGGRFITLPMVHTRDLHTGVRNVGMYRMQLFDGQTTGMHWHRHKTGARHYEQYKAAGQKMPVAVALGGDPIYAYCAVAPLPDNVDEYLLAGFLRGEPVRLTRCVTQPIDAPADADFVIEGYVDPAEPLATEGPFGDHTGFYSLPDAYPRFHVTAITRRRDAIYPATVVGIPPQEDAYIGKATERIFLAPIRLAMLPEIADMHMPFEGVAHNIAIVKINKTYPGQAEKTANALWGAGQMMFNKMLVVVDGDVDVQRYGEVCACVQRNFRPATDAYFGRGALDVLDHSAQACGYGGKLCVDATRKLPEEASALPQREKRLLYKFTHQAGEDTDSLIRVVFDSNVDLDDLATCVWLMGNNVDPARDCSIKNGALIIDARGRHKSRSIVRSWPEVICASPATIAAVDQKWEKLGLGSFIPSPSLRYMPLLSGSGGAVAGAKSSVKK